MTFNGWRWVEAEIQIFQNLFCFLPPTLFFFFNFFKPPSKNLMLTQSSHRLLIVPQGGGCFLKISVLQTLHFTLTAWQVAKGARNRNQTVCFLCTPGVSYRRQHCGAGALVFELCFTGTRLGREEAGVSECFCVPVFSFPGEAGRPGRSCSRRRNY